MFQRGHLCFKFPFCKHFPREKNKSHKKFLLYAKFSQVAMFIRMVLIVQVHKLAVSSPYQMKFIDSSLIDEPVVHCG